KMKIVYSHFPITVKVEGNKILVGNFIGEKIPRVARIIGDAKVEVKGQDIIITGLNKEDVGQTMSSIEQICRITKFDRRIFQDGVYFTGEDDG
ncbi:MAG: 50S ribosomal protein L6, partial [Candidatus Aenigmarchaeota archaeon]|nr:50S ribosomal protein L6 [Candidatus Aenigmarchaeota archaeon]